MVASIQKNQNKSIAQLIKIAVRHFHAYIRARDQGKPCISCGSYVKLECGHFYSAGNYPALRFNENNTAGQCKRCNYYLHGNLTEYEKRLRQRIGDEAVDDLHLKAAQYKRLGFKWDRFTLIEIIEKYKALNK